MAVLQDARENPSMKSLNMKVTYGGAEARYVLGDHGKDQMDDIKLICEHKTWSKDEKIAEIDLLLKDIPNWAPGKYAKKEVRGTRESDPAGEQGASGEEGLQFQDEFADDVDLGSLQMWTNRVLRDTA